MAALEGGSLPVQMPEDDRLASDVIMAYRRRRERMVPFLLGALAVVLLVVGLVLIVIWFTGDNPPQLPALLQANTATLPPTNTPSPPTQTPPPSPTSAPSETPTPSGPITYIVEEGDTLFSIAAQFVVSIDALIFATTRLAPNNIHLLNPRHLWPMLGAFHQFFQLFA